MTRLSSTLFIAALALSAVPAQAAVTFTITENATDIAISAEGSLNIAGLTPNSTGVFDFPGIQPELPGIFAGSTGNFTDYNVDDNGATLLPFGTGDVTSTASSSGTIVGVQDNDGDFQIFVPEGYSSGAPLSATATVNGTFASLGITPGTYVYSYDGANGNGPADTITIIATAIPEPASLVLLGLGAVALLGRRRAAIRTV